MNLFGNSTRQHYKHTFMFDLKFGTNFGGLFGWGTEYSAEGISNKMIKGTDNQFTATNRYKISGKLTFKCEWKQISENTKMRIFRTLLWSRDNKKYKITLTNPATKWFECYNDYCESFSFSDNNKPTRIQVSFFESYDTWEGPHAYGTLTFKNMKKFKGRFEEVDFIINVEEEQEGVEEEQEGGKRKTNRRRRNKKRHNKTAKRRRRI